MRQVIGGLRSYTRGEGYLDFAGEGGVIRLALYGPGALYVSYRFDGFSMKENVADASAYMLRPAAFAPFTGTVTQSKTSFIVDFGNGLTAELLKREGLLAVYLDGKEVHGGTIGSGDLVVPQYPARLLTNGGQAVGRFNFALRAHDEVFGLGDKGGIPCRVGQRYSMFNRDSLSYDAEKSDPLYKSIPFYIKRSARTGAMAGVFFPMPCIRSIDVGRESPFYIAVEAEDGPFDYCVLTGKTYRDIVSNYCRLTGMPALPPLYSFGFFGSSMNYLEPDDAAQRVLDYFDRVEKENIPCEGMYFSSGYLKAPDGKRYALLWNRAKFPDYGTYLKRLKDRGYHLLMNIKPGILLTHPWYEELKRKGYFIRDAEGGAYVEYFWGGGASFIDFENQDARAWWIDELKKQYLDHGCDGIWNDNNELELEDSAMPAYATRSVYPVRMAEAAYDAFKQKAPDRRPWVYSRAGYAGLQRYARTWTGDNRSDYATLRCNQYMGLSLGLCGLPYYGHDLGGFFGDFPEKELLIRCCESGVFQARFVIHSWRMDGRPTEPWSYPDALPVIRSLIVQHYRFMPYIYDCAIEAHLTGEPIERMLCLEYPCDAALSSDELNTLYGPFVLKVTVASPGVEDVPVHLPAGDDWYDPRSGLLWRGGLNVRKETPMDGSAHFFVRRGAVLPQNESVSQLTTGLIEHTELALYPPKEGRKVCFNHYEDDGVTELSLGQYNCYSLTLTSSTVVVSKTASGLKPIQKGQRRHRLTLPEGFVFIENHAAAFAYDPDALTEDLVLSFEGCWKEGDGR